MCRDILPRQQNAPKRVNIYLVKYVTVVITAVAWGMGVLGTDTSLETASWCWIDPRTPHTLLWQFVTGKFMEIVAYITTVVLYTVLKIFLQKQVNPCFCQEIVTNMYGA
ncbi:hypothetical protein DPMN_111568 [Dreissena polymorpha]|uniref:G-protein coupled receptors family 2 profile 2 domain-containing protein n=1 Tax=Dreissena polymorpha TaxID=45954 RepID=A0A9D4KEI3_DREPO|nr:hypothetical protein DPMN_111568 [Dreissena polymorpha]